jgi:hypothetical protein
MFELQSKEINAISESFAKAQGEFPKIGKDKEGHNYKYVEMQTVLYAVLPVLSKHGLSLWQGTIWAEGKTFLATFLRHSSGQWFASYAPYLDIKTTGRNPYQDFGTATTYLKRYQAMSILGIHADKDYDASDLEEPEIKEPVKQIQEQPAPKEKITFEQRQMLERELKGHEDIAEDLMDKLHLKSLSDLPEHRFLDILERIREIKRNKER